MTDLEMIEALRARGYRVIPPRDLRIAGPWTPTPDTRRPGWERVWEDSTVAAVRVTEVSSRCCRHRQCCCESHDPTWKWSASLIGNRLSKSTDGWSDSPECAKMSADEALLDLLERARAARLNQIEHQTGRAEPSERLMLLPDSPL